MRFHEDDEIVPHLKTEFAAPLGGLGVSLGYLFEILSPDLHILWVQHLIQLQHILRLTEQVGKDAVFLGPFCLYHGSAPFLI